MAGNATDGEAPPKRTSRPLLLMLPAVLLLGGGSFYAVYSGLVALPFLDQGGAEEAGEAGSEPSLGPGGGGRGAVESAYVALEPLVIALGPEASARHLKLAVEIETSPGERDAVAAVTPRIADVLNTFLRAIDESDIAEPHAMIRLRAQMLRRVRLVAPPGAVRDLLIQEFVLN